MAKGQVCDVSCPTVHRYKPGEMCFQRTPARIVCTSMVRTSTRAASVSGRATACWGRPDSGRALPPPAAAAACCRRRSPCMGGERRSLPLRRSLSANHAGAVTGGPGLAARPAGRWQLGRPAGAQPRSAAQLEHLPRVPLSAAAGQRQALRRQAENHGAGRQGRQRVHQLLPGSISG